MKNDPVALGKHSYCYPISLIAPHVNTDGTLLVLKVLVLSLFWCSLSLHNWAWTGPPGPNTDLRNKTELNWITTLSFIRMIITRCHRLWMTMCPSLCGQMEEPGTALTPTGATFVAVRSCYVYQVIARKPCLWARVKCQRKVKLMHFIMVNISICQLWLFCQHRSLVSVLFWGVSGALAPVCEPVFAGWIQSHLTLFTWLAGFQQRLDNASTFCSFLFGLHENLTLPPRVRAHSEEKSNLYWWKTQRF